MNAITENQMHKVLQESVVGSTFYVDVSQEDGAKLHLLDIKLKSMDSLSRTFQINRNNDNESWSTLVERYSEALGEKLAIITINTTRELGEDIIPIISEPCWEVGYDSVKEKIFLHKICPINRTGITYQVKGEK